ncbi:MAG: hypothetical protein UY13_C0001G0028 [Candidatus Pacebacteria bacterium GW2011_GWB1_47_8]|nr:MAG: hypothetical protein UX28_C0003G0043 [Candidatus Pacebacteria bacterium GW2011_GWA1_46_10]KKU84706.1 MAG: hypothetical protein UY13_C0001G0028 [Candidatus Pacebacteria bacterium GW2011_GWB1_47_8]HCR81018.1 hypothetical protein [Candidatus Paceibacterota bacterium]
MKKEVIIAILIGLSLGLFITYGVYQARTGRSRQNTSPDLTESNVQDEFSGELVINSPLDESVQNQSTVSISGTTLPNSFVVVFVGNKETITSTDNSGNFSVEVELEDSSNIITVYVIDEDGRSLSVERVVFVTDETFDEATESAQPEEK